MRQYLNILQQEIPKISEADLYVPIRNTHIDSIDLVVIRVALEKHFQIEIPDTLWFNYQTLIEALEYFHKNRKKVHEDFVYDKPEISISEDTEVRMPQMINSALSENWLLKFLGDTHWQLLSKGFDKKSSDFKDELGNRLYATFIRIQYHTSPLNQFFENEFIKFISSIKSFGNNSFLSDIKGNSRHKSIRATLLTTFSIKENANNTKISKCEPKVKTNKISQLHNTPMFLNEFRLLRKGLIDTVSTDFGAFHISDNILFSCKYEINPYSDINGVGLLYFASYPIIADKCLLEYNYQTINYQTIHRDIFYFANCNSSDTIIFILNTIDEDETLIKTLSSLSRVSDNQLLARILTVKQKTE